MKNSFAWIFQLKFLNLLKEIEICQKDQYYFYVKNMHYRHDFYKKVFFDFLIYTWCIPVNGNVKGLSQENPLISCLIW